MAKGKVRYVLLPSDGMAVSEQNPQQKAFFQVLHAVSTSETTRTHSLSVANGTTPITVVDSIGEQKAKLIEMDPDDLAAFRGQHPSARVAPLVYYRPALMRHEVMTTIKALRSRVSAKKAKAKSTRLAVKASVATGSISLTVTSAKDGKGVAGATVVAFTDFAEKAGAQGTTDAQGRVALALGASSKKVERVYIYPESGYWPALQSDVTLKSGGALKVLPIDTAYVDCVRYFYGPSKPEDGKGVTVGVIDSGVATGHPGLKVAGGGATPCPVRTRTISETTAPRVMARTWPASLRRRANHRLASAAWRRA